MEIRDISSQFSITIFTPNIDRGTQLKVHLSKLNYQTQMFVDANALTRSFQNGPSHVLIFDAENLPITLSDFFQQILHVAPETQFVSWSNLVSYPALEQYRPYGLQLMVDGGPELFCERCALACDNVVEKLFFTYQNEKLLSDLKQEKQKVRTFESERSILSQEKNLLLDKTAQLEKALSETPASVGLGGVTAFISEFRSITSKEELIEKAMHWVCPSHALYFKFIPSLKSFVVTSSKGFTINEVKGVGCQLTTEEFNQLSSKVTSGLVPDSLAVVLKEGFQEANPVAAPLFAQGNLEGIFVISSRSGGFKKEEFKERMSLLSLIFSHFHLEKKVDLLEVQDYVTELYNRSYYLKALNDEMSRSRRLKEPVSVIKVSVDDFVEIENSLGEAQRDDLLKSIGTSILKTSRTNDINCRVGFNEFAILLPHCSKKGASLRAERLRRLVEALAPINSNIKVSVSIGISEFPSLSSDLKSLDETSTKALNFISQRGGNKICLFRAPDSHKPEFNLPSET